MPISWELIGKLALQEAELCLPLHRRSQVSCLRKLCYSNPWTRQTLKDYGIIYKKVPILCDNESSIKIANNPCQHPHNKHIDIRHHFIWDHIQKGDIVLAHVGTDKQLADIFMKTLDEARFCQLRGELGTL